MIALLQENKTRTILHTVQHFPVIKKKKSEHENIFPHSFLYFQGTAENFTVVKKEQKTKKNKKLYIFFQEQRKI